MTHLRKMMLEELQRRNFSRDTMRHYIRTVEDFARHFNLPPDRLGLRHIREYQAELFVSGLLCRIACCTTASGASETALADLAIVTLSLLLDQTVGLVSLETPSSEQKVDVWVRQNCPSPDVICVENTERFLKANAELETEEFS